MQVIQSMGTKAEMSPWIETVSGRQFWFLNPQQDQIDIKDIAWALSCIPRFGGHSKKTLSVAEHSLYVSALCPDHLKLEGLLHDASEAYLLDIPSPIKPYLTNYKEMENKILSAIYVKYLLGVPTSKPVKEADNIQLHTEAYYLLPSRGETWNTPRPENCQGFEPKCLKQEQAYYSFLSMFYKLWKDHQFNVRKEL